jgi:hypothetical protein
LAEGLTPDLISEVIATACSRLPLLNKTGEAARLDQFVESGTWSDAALLIVELELPAWKLRRLICESGEWHCSLSKQAYLPVELDDTAGGRIALVGAQGDVLAARPPPAI